MFRGFPIGPMNTNAPQCRFSSQPNVKKGRIGDTVGVMTCCLTVNLEIAKLPLDPRTLRLPTIFLDQLQRNRVSWGLALIDEEFCGAIAVDDQNVNVSIAIQISKSSTTTGVGGLLVPAALGKHLFETIVYLATEKLIRFRIGI